MSRPHIADPPPFVRAVAPQRGAQRAGLYLTVAGVAFLFLASLLAIASSGEGEVLAGLEDALRRPSVERVAETRTRAAAVGDTSRLWPTGGARFVLGAESDLTADRVRAVMLSGDAGAQSALLTGGQCRALEPGTAARVERIAELLVPKVPGPLARVEVLGGSEAGRHLWVDYAEIESVTEEVAWLRFPLGIADGPGAGRVFRTAELLIDCSRWRAQGRVQAVARASARGAWRELAPSTVAILEEIKVRGSGAALGRVQLATGGQDGFGGWIELPEPRRLGLRDWEGARVPLTYID